MLLGADALGRLVLGQISNGRSGKAEGVLLVVHVSIRPGVASSSPLRVSSGGPLFGRPKQPVSAEGRARGATIGVGVTFTPGFASGHHGAAVSPALAHGSSMQVQAFLIPGRASGGGGASGVMIEVNLGVNYDNDLLMIA